MLLDKPCSNLSSCVILQILFKFYELHFIMYEMRILITVFKAEYETGILVAVISLRGTGERRCSWEGEQIRIRKSKT